MPNRKFGASQADKYFYTVFEYFDLTGEQPYSFEQVDFIRKGYRSCVCGSDSIFYRIINETVEIMAIIGRQDLNKIF